MADEQHRPTFAARELIHLAETFFLEFDVADGENLVDNQDFRFEVGCNGEGEAYIHARGIAFDRSVDELLNLGEGDDLVEFLADFRPTHTEDRAVEINVFAASQFGVKSGANLEQA